MGHYDAWPDPAGKVWLRDMQADLLRDLNTRVVVPLLPVAVAPFPAARLNPVFSVNGADDVMVTQFLSAVPAGLLRDVPVTLDARAADISNALDMVLTGV